MNYNCLLRRLASRSPHGERGLKCFRDGLFLLPFPCRSPHGERGLKYGSVRIVLMLIRSLSSWRAWIEIRNCPNFDLATLGRSPHGERGLKLIFPACSASQASVALLMESVD